jgi:hypothetical protein
MTKTITLNIAEYVDKEFRKIVIQKYGVKKGNLSRAVEDAFKLFIQNINSNNADIDLLTKINNGYNLGGLLYKNRDKLHEWRNH